MPARTSAQWLQEIKSSPEKIKEWLARQYVGERLAAHRILELVSEAPQEHRQTLATIALDECQHAEWVEDLLVARGIPIPEVGYGKDRYWKEVLGPFMSFDDLAAAGAHAERMRLERISLLAADPDIDADIREVFARILPDEQFHAKAFSQMAPLSALERMSSKHLKGMAAIGLLEAAD